MGEITLLFVRVVIILVGALLLAWSLSGVGDR